MYAEIVISYKCCSWHALYVYITHCELYHLLCITLLECVYINSVTVHVALLYSSTCMYYVLLLISDSVSYYDFRAASLLVCGNQSMFTEFRVRTVCELTTNEEYYLQPSITSFCSDTGVVTKNVLFATSANFHRASDICLTESSVEHVRVCFRLDCCETTKSGTYSNLWHMHGLASVLKQPIQSIYPEVGERNRPFYHKVIQPRQACQLIPLIIMWTGALPTPLNKFWQPNHFVPCLRDSNISQIPASSTDTAKVLKDNVAVSRTVSEFDKAVISTPGVKRACCQSPLLQTGSTQHSRDKFCVYLQANSPLV